MTGEARSGPEQEPTAAGSDPVADPPVDEAGPAEAGVGEESGTRRKRPLSHELPVLLLFAVILALLLKAFVVQAFYIPSGSMERTLLIQDRVLVNRVGYRLHDIHRGDIVVFNGSGTGFTQSESTVPEPTSLVGRGVRSVQRVLGAAAGERDFVKRVIAVGGDTVACCDAQGRVTVNGTGLDEPYIYENSPLDGGRTFPALTVPDGELWVMGDHRGDSADSRYNGPIPTNKVIGRAFVRVWPIKRFAVLKAPGSTFKSVRDAAPIGSGVVLLPAFLLRGRPGRPRRRR